MKKINQKIVGNGNIQISGDFIKTEKIIKKTEVIYDSEYYISDSQAKEIRDRIQKIALEMSGDKKIKVSPYQAAYKSLYNKFNITKYSLLPKVLYEDAIKWLDKQIAINRPKMKNVDSDQFRKDYYKSIHTKARQDNIKIHDFAFEYLNLKHPIESLTELSDADLIKLYNRLFNKKSRKKE